MAEMLADDDDMILIVVGDEVPGEDNQDINSQFVTVKVEPLDYIESDPAMENIQTIHGECIDLKEEDDFEIEALEDDPIGCQDELIDQKDIEVYIPEGYGDANDQFQKQQTKKPAKKKNKAYGRQIKLKEPKEEMEEVEDDEKKGYIPEGYEDPSDHIYQKKKKGRAGRKKKDSDGHQDEMKVPKKEIKDTNGFDVEENESQGQRKRLKTKTSYVNHLFNTNPEMKKNPALLIDHLVQLMRDARPLKALPSEFCVRSKDGTQFECCYCKAKNKSLASARRHYHNCHGERFLICYACGADFRRTENLYKHEKRCRAADAKFVMQARACYLGRRGRSRPFLAANKFQRKYEAKLIVKKRLYCTKCPASFSHRENLVAHENSHEGLRPFRCHICPAAYTSDPGLKRHLQTHSDIKFICDHCEREFKFKPALVSHMDTHRPMRKFGCPLCERRFAQKNALVHHINKHLDLPAAYGCPVCPKRYARVTHVKEHMKRKHGLAMITRQMFYKTLPTLSDSEVVQEAKIVFDAEMEEFTPSPNERGAFAALPVSSLPKNIKPEQVRAITIKKRDTSTSEVGDGKHRIVQGGTSSKYQNEEQRVYEIVLEENAAQTDEIRHDVKSTKPGKKLSKVSEASHVTAVIDNPVKVIRVPCNL